MPSQKATSMARTERRLWTPESTAFGGRQSRRRFYYDAFLPKTIADLDLRLHSDVATVVTDAETEVRALNERAPDLGALEVLARQLLRAEAVASSRIEASKCRIGDSPELRLTRRPRTVARSWSSATCVRWKRRSSSEPRLGGCGSRTSSQSTRRYSGTHPTPRSPARSATNRTGSVAEMIRPSALSSFHRRKIRYDHSWRISASSWPGRMFQP